MEAGQSTQQTPFVPPMGPQEIQAPSRAPREVTPGEEERNLTLQQWADYRKALNHRLEAIEAETAALLSIRDGLTAALAAAQEEKAERPY